MGTRIIVNADDLGHGDAVNRSVFDLMECRRVTSATILANEPAVGEAVRTARAFPHCSFGVHLNVTEFEPLTNAPALRALNVLGGVFTGNLRAAGCDRAVRAAIYGEWCAQVARLRAMGLEVSHLDSHHHAHTVPALFSILKRVQRAFGIRKVRITRNLFAPSEPAATLKRSAKHLWNFALRHVYTTTATDHFGFFETFQACLRRGGRLEGSVELMVHPGHPGYHDETGQLRGPWIEALGTQARLISYRDL